MSIQRTEACPSAASCQSSCCGSPNQEFTPSKSRAKTIALVGQPNTGKSTLFNMLTGGNQHVGNWPGKTVEKKEGTVVVGSETIHVYDLPGTYSLTANSLEEIITRDFLIREQPDVVVVVVDASQLERSMYMIAEVVSLGTQMIVALNKMDMAVKQGYEINPDAFEKMTGFVTIPITASKKEGIAELLEATQKIGAAEPAPICKIPLPGTDIPQYDNILKVIQNNIPTGYSGEWLTSKLFEGDTEVAELVAEKLSPQELAELKSILPHPDESQMTIAKARYDWISKILPSLIISNPQDYKRSRFDVAATHPIWGKLIALSALFLSVIATYLVMIPFMIPGFAMFLLAKPLQQVLTGIVPPSIYHLICDGLMGGLSIALIVLGFIGAVFIVLGFLENSGYLARLAYCFDPFMRRIGLHGKSIMPMIMGFVCNIIGVSGSRVIDTWKQRLVTLVITPIIPCKGVFMVAGFITAVFFGVLTPFIFLSLAVVTICYISITSLVLQKYILKGNSTGLLMELPPYQIPNWRNIWIFAKFRMKTFYSRGFWFIVAACVILWFGVYFPDGSIDNSYLALFGKKLEFLGQVVGWDWRFCITFLIAIFSKETTLAAMALIFGTTTAADTDLVGMAMDMDLMAYIKSGDFGSYLDTTGLSKASALAFVYAVFFSLPCVGTLAAIYAETKSKLITLGTFLYYFSMSIIMGGLAYLVGLMVF